MSMDYRKLLETLSNADHDELLDNIDNAICAITNLLARAEAAEAQLRKVRQILSDPLIVCGENNTLRPVKRTSKQDVYTTVLKAQKAAGVMERWFPEEWEET